MTDISLAQSKITHKEWRKLAKKLRRAKIRQAKALARETEQRRNEASPTYLNNFLKLQLLKEAEMENEERVRSELHNDWLCREEEAQRQFKEQQIIKNKQESERRAMEEKIKAEWDLAQKKKEQKKKLELAQQEETQSRIELFVKEGGEIPLELKCVTQTNPGSEPCPFFSKVSACRFGPTCSRNHIVPALSRVILIPNFYVHFTLSSSRSNEYDTDVSLEFEETETYKDFKEFFSDVVSELERFGKVVVIQVCRNSEPHLRGNLYAEYSTEREALLAARGLNARWYGGRQLTVYFAILQDWGAAICGDYKKGRCPKGSECNFLHVFRNPRGWCVPSIIKPFVQQRSVRSWRWSESPEREPHSRRNRSDSSSASLKHGYKERENRSKNRTKGREIVNSADKWTNRSRSRERKRRSNSIERENRNRSNNRFRSERKSSGHRISNEKGLGEYKLERRSSRKSKS